LAESESAPVPKNCEKCGGVLGADLPVCPRCFSSNVKISRFIESPAKK
jgi:ABC-type ATPase with predicted acetyltransferase domain